MTVVKVEEEAVKVDENPALVGESPGNLVDEAEAGYVSPDDEDGDDEDDETDSDGDYETPSGGRVPQLKKGPWTPEEDRRLKDYVEAHGEGNWNKVQRNAGLNRCGKSCGLRWANHLRPDLKKGPFDAEEVDKIIRFHIMWGNKWAKMASHLPGRTDNEIKNYWNTRLKRNERHGLPVYPEYMLSQVTHPHEDINYETPGESHGKKQLNEYSKEKVVGIHDLMDEVMTFQHLDYEKDPVVPTEPLKRYASTGSLQIPDEAEKTFCSTDLSYVLTKTQSLPLSSGYLVGLPSFQSSSYTSNESSSYTLTNDWLLLCPSVSIEQQIIQSPESISSQTTGLLGASIHNSDILDDPTKSGRSFEIPIPMVYPMMHSSSFLGNSEHEGCPVTKIQASNLYSGSDDVFSLGQCYPVARFFDPGIPDTSLGANLFNDTSQEASFMNDDYLKDQSHLYWQEPKPLTDGGQWFDPCHKLDFQGP